MSPVGDTTQTRRPQTSRTTPWWPQRDSNPCLVPATFSPGILVSFETREVAGHDSDETRSMQEAPRTSSAGSEASLAVEQRQEPFHVQLGITDQPAQQARLQSLVVRDGQGLAPRVLGMPQAEMAPLLPDSLAPRDDGQPRTHWVTTTLPTNTCEGSGIG